MTRLQDISKRRMILIGAVLAIAIFALVTDTTDKTKDILVPSDLSVRKQERLTKIDRSDLIDTNRDCQKRLPESIVIGVHKAGTQAFQSFLMMHPQVAMALAMIETKFFAQNYDKGFSWYINKMKCSTSDQISMEKAEHYFTSIHPVPKRIHQLNPNMKMILIVRSPVDRAISQHLQQLQNVEGLPQYNTFEECAFTQSGNVNANCRYLKGSRYSTSLKRWLQYFPRNQILIIDGDKFKTVPFESMAQTEQFLGISTFITEDKFVYNETKGFYCRVVHGCMGSGKGRAHPVLNHEHLTKLQEHFKPYNKEFYELTGRRFNW